MRIMTVLTTMNAHKVLKTVPCFVCAQFPWVFISSIITTMSQTLKFRRGGGQVWVWRGGNQGGGRCLSPTDVQVRKLWDRAAERTENKNKWIWSFLVISWVVCQVQWHATAPPRSLHSFSIGSSARMPNYVYVFSLAGTSKTTHPLGPWQEDIFQR